MRAFSLLAFLLPLVAANEHKQCSCQTWTNDQEGWKHDADLTRNVCGKNFYDVAKWDDGSQRCIAFPHKRIDGDLWNGDCIQHGVTNGYHSFTPDGYVDETSPVKHVNQAVGDCFHT
ncbi:hypothetical protein E4U60_003429 [Claviceps pazoutovae]|uniref:Uncharacterized protein n=1 Tax=Claviceps pazoutovae TaxID=1649127 RepID=A0A9P7MA53_9HYPO|nr:hypothetical protein E4U60_003429 [Claviceps pazoutovae]